jgi:histone demethylase JARID1
LPAHQYGSGFPIFSTPKTQDSNFDYVNSYFNLNNIYKAPASVLRMSEENNEKISGITIPWVYMGMLFSTFCWHVEDLWLNSLNYSHKGSTKTWYIIPESDKDAFDSFILKKVGHR